MVKNLDPGTRQFRQEVKRVLFRDIWFYILSTTAIGLIIASFVVPPTGVIDPSVLAATGEVFAFAALGTVIHAIDAGIDAKVTHNNTTVEVSNPDPKE